MIGLKEATGSIERATQLGERFGSGCPSSAETTLACFRSIRSAGVARSRS